MTNRTTESVIETASPFLPSPIAQEFINRTKEGNLTKDENEISHFVVYFAGYDPVSKKVFIGHHIKSGKWIFNGGHVDKDEIIKEALKREIQEEWNIDVDLENIKNPNLLTITLINNPPKQKCRVHFDFWYFIPLSEQEFHPDQVSLGTEFFTTGWKTIDEAKGLIIDPSSLIALDKFSKLFEQK